MVQHLLLVEDDADQSALYTLALTGHGYHLDVVASAEEALTLLAATDILLTDLRLPGMSGSELIAYVQQQQLPIKTVLMSNYEEIRQAAQSAGADGWVNKLDGVDALIAAVRRVSG